MAGRNHVKRLLKALEDLNAARDAVTRVDAARRVREEAEALESAHVMEARRAGVTWDEIGWIYDMTKQGAQQRFRRTSPG